MIGSIVTGYERFKAMLVPHDEDVRALLHIHFGLACWLVLVLALRREMGSILPIAAVWLLCLLGEAADLFHLWPVRYAWVWRDMAGDIFNTLAWPTAIWLLASWREWRRDRKRAAGGIETGSIATTNDDIVDRAATVGDKDR